MSHVYTPTPQPLGDITLPDDDDDADASSINTPLEALADAVAGTSYPPSVTAVITASDPTYNLAALRGLLDSATWVHFVVVGGGGAGGYPNGSPGGGGGGGGAVVDEWLPSSEVPDEISIIVDPGAVQTSSGLHESDGSFSQVGWTAGGGNVSLVANGGKGGYESGLGGEGGVTVGEEIPGSASVSANGDSARRLDHPGAGGGGGGGGGGPDPGGSGGRSAYGTSGGAGGNLGGGTAGRGYGAGGGGVGAPTSTGGGGGGAGGYGTDLLAGNASATNGGAGAPGVVIITIYRGTVVP